MVGTWHNIALNFGNKESLLFVDGWTAARGPVLPSASPDTSGFVIGSSAAGTEAANGELDEISFYGKPLKEIGVGVNYAVKKGLAMLGPITPEEDAARLDRIAK